MNLHLTLEQDEDGVWIAESRSIPRCLSQGHDRATALQNIAEAIQASLEVRPERGMSLVVEDA